MKNIIILLCASLFLFGCNENPKKNYILLSGVITDATSKDFKLQKRYNDANSEISIKLTDDGSFISDTITFGTGRYAFYNGRNVAELYLTSGGKYNLTAVSKKFSTTAKLTGTNPDASNYLMSKIARIIRLRGSYKVFNSLNEKEFIAKQKELNANYVSYLDSFPNMQKEFAKKERKELHYYNLLTLFRYEATHIRYTKKTDFKVSESFKNQLNEIDFYDIDEYKIKGSYKKLVDEYFRTKSSELAEKEGVNKYLARLTVYGEIPNDEIKNTLLLTAANSDIKLTNNKEEYFKAFKAVSTSAENNEKIKEKYESLVKLNKGYPSPIFTDYVNHAGGTTSLSDFKGKYVYIDVWATWCGPCLKEVPALKEVEKQYHGKNIEFVSISIDVEKAHGKWRKMVTNKELAGVQLLADKNWQSEFIKGYQINGIPRFILIDPNGNIVSPNAPRPSSAELMTLLNQLSI
ncbi:MAG: TlpA disulfide reductase family protein [Algibacter sp.]